MIVFVVLGVHCDDGDDKYSYPRDLDRVCRFGACTVSGTAQQIKGVSDDSIAFEFEPGYGEVTMPASKYRGNQLLLAGEGTLTILNQPDDRDRSVALANEGEWVYWDTNATGVLRVSLSGSHPAWLLDMRTYIPDSGCD